MYEVEFRRSVERAFKKLSRKDPKRLGMILEKISEIKEDPQRYKNLRYPLNRLKRVHIDSSFVLVFSVDEANEVVTIEDYGHHDEIYRI